MEVNVAAQRGKLTPRDTLDTSHCSKIYIIHQICRDAFNPTHIRLRHHVMIQQLDLLLINDYPLKVEVYTTSRYFET